MSLNYNLPLVVNNVVQPAVYFFGGNAILSVASTSPPASITVQILLADGVTYFSTTLTGAANGLYGPASLPPGKVQALVVTPGTGLYANLQSIPTNLN
jgi:hypothetical protein